MTVKAVSPRHPLARQTSLAVILLAIIALVTGCTNDQPWPPSFGDGYGPNGIVTVNYTHTIPDVGATVTIQKAGTNWMDTASLTIGNWQPGSRLVGIRIALDLTETKNMGYNIDENTGQPTEIVLYTDPDADGYSHKATCYSFWKNHKELPWTQEVLTLIGGDIPLYIDNSTMKGEGWIVCAATADVASYFYQNNGYFLQSNAIYVYNSRHNNVGGSDDRFQLHIIRDLGTPTP